MWWGEFDFSVIKVEISQKIMSISCSTADNFKNVQSFACNLTSFESKVLSKALGVNIGKRTESHRTKVTKLLGQKVTGQKVTIYIFYPGGQKVTGQNVTTYIFVCR